MGNGSVLDKKKGMPAPNGLKGNEDINRSADDLSGICMEGGIDGLPHDGEGNSDAAIGGSGASGRGVVQERGKHNKKLGKRGEEAATAFLIKHGYEIIERNWTCFAGEADIICRFDKTLVFVEVKTRKGIDHGFPSEHVDKSKRNKYEKIALAYISENVSEEMRFRFDVISIIVNNPKLAYVRHYIDAFGVA